jgi:glycosyltransferase 2 family protein
VEALRRLAGSFWARALVSAGLLALVASRIDFHTAGHRLANGHWQWFALAVVVVVGAFLVGTLRWQVYLEAAGVHVRLARVLRAYLIGVFSTNFLPSQVGGDVARAWIVGGAGTRMRAAATVVVDRVVALACLIAVAWIGVAANPGPVPGSLLVALAVVTGGYAIGAALAVLLLRGGGRLRHLVPARVHAPARDASDAARRSIALPVLARTTAYGLVFQGLAALSAWLIGLSISLDVPFSTLVTTLPLVLVLAVVPISVGGLGVREGAFVVLLGRAGVGTTEATVFSLLSGLGFAIASLPGAVALLHRGGRPEAVERTVEPITEALLSDHEPGELL